MRAENPHSSQPSAADADMRKTALYAEIEELYRTIYKPGSGRVVNGTEPRVSPDGQLTALTGVMLEKLEGVPTTRICLLDRGAGLRVATFGPNTDCSPAFSPDGRTVAFRSDRGRPGNFQLYFLDVATVETRAAPTVEGWVEYFAFSPDGLRILLGVAGHGADVAGAQGAKVSERHDERDCWRSADMRCSGPTRAAAPGEDRTSRGPSSATWEAPIHTITCQAWIGWSRMELPIRGASR